MPTPVYGGFDPARAWAEMQRLQQTGQSGTFAPGAFQTNIGGGEGGTWDQSGAIPFEQAGSWNVGQADASHPDGYLVMPNSASGWVRPGGEEYWAYKKESDADAKAGHVSGTLGNDMGSTVYNNKPYDRFGGNQSNLGQYLGSDKFGDLVGGDDLLTWALIAATMGTAGAMGAGAGAAGGGGAEAVAGAANGMWDVLPEAVGNGSGLTTSVMGAAPEIASSTAPAWTSAAADSQLANAAIDAAGGNSLSAYTAAGTGGVTASPLSGGNTLSNLLSGNGNYLGAASTLLGGLAGSQGQDQNSTTNRDVPAWLKPYLTGSDGHAGLLAYVQQLLEQQMAPGAMQGYTDMQNVGRTLMQRPIAGNPTQQRGLTSNWGAR